MDANETGNLLVITAPSGAGKTSFIRLFMERNHNFVFSVSHTSRPPREEETNGKEYYFVEGSFFESKERNDDFFVEWAVVHNYHYGTSWEELRRLQSMGKNIILDIDVQGANLLRRKLKAFYVALAVRDISILRERLRSRHTETEEKMKVRLDNADREIRLLSGWKHRIMNDNLLEAVETLERLLESVGFFGSNPTGMEFVGEGGQAG